MQADAPSSSSLDNGGATCNGSAAVAQDEAHASHRRALVFSPHPDDDVISMGGTLARLCQQGLEVGLAFRSVGVAMFGTVDGVANGLGAPSVILEGLLAAYRHAAHAHRY